MPTETKDFMVVVWCGGAIEYEDACMALTALKKYLNLYHAPGSSDLRHEWQVLLLLAICSRSYSICSKMMFNSKSLCNDALAFGS